MLSIIAHLLTALVAIEHLYILWIEVFAWETAGKRTFDTLPEELFKSTKVLAANQGVYNGFLSVGLLWSFMISDPTWAFNIRLFFLGCVIVAGIYGAFTLSRKIAIFDASTRLLCAPLDEDEPIVIEMWLFNSGAVFSQ